MKPIDHIIIALSSEIGSTGIYHLKRLWGKVIAGPEVASQFPHEMVLDSALLDMLGIGLLPAYQFLHEQKPGFDAFEQWVMVQANGHIDEETIQRCNALVKNKTIPNKNILPDILNTDDLSFWDEQGYVIVKQVISPQDCADGRKAIMDFLDMDEQDETSWYKEINAMQGIMVPLYRNAAIDKNRNASKIRRAFEQLWKRTDLIVTTDKCGFNPPETSSFRYRGTGLHWDVSLATPIPFGTQGILYLTDTAAHQGALTVIPGFHKIIEPWLKELPENMNPRDADLSRFVRKPIAANAGDMVIWNHQLPHGSSPNKAGKPRIVQYINWYAPSEKVQEEWI